MIYKLFSILIVTSIFFITKPASAQNSIRYWPNGVVPYEIHPEANESFIAQSFIKACQTWGMAGRVQCRPRRSSDRNYVYVVPYEYSFSQTGMQGGRQEVGIARDGNFRHTLHEIGHLLGFEHEHVRSDRDRYIEILWDEMYPEAMPDYYIKPEYRQSTPYDIDSVMHYTPASASATGYATMLSRDGRTRFGNTGQLTDYDKIDLVNIYGR